MAKYIKCDCCGKRIHLGEEVYKFNGYAGLFCSAECFSDSYGEVQELDDELASDCYHTVYDDDVEMAIRREISNTLEAIENLQLKLKGLEFDLASYGNP